VTAGSPGTDTPAGVLPAAFARPANDPRRGPVLTGRRHRHTGAKRSDADGTYPRRGDRGMSKLREIGPGHPLPGSPVAALMAATVVAVAAGEVPCACPHPGLPAG